jgi:hypothetical protein
MQAATLPTFWRWTGWSMKRPQARNLQLLLDTHLVVPARFQGRYRVDKKTRLRYTYDRKLELAQVAVVQGYQTLGYLPLPDAQLVYGWRQSKLKYSFRILEAGTTAFGNTALRLRITMP